MYATRQGLELSKHQMEENIMGTVGVQLYQAITRLQVFLEQNKRRCRVRRLSAG